MEIATDIIMCVSSCILIGLLLVLWYELIKLLLEEYNDDEED